MYLLLSIIFLAITQSLSFAAEPRCSRFHYEEQLLEKMIRMEVKVEEVEKRISKTNQNVINVLEELKIERTKMKNDNVELQTNYAKEMEERMNDVTDLKALVLTDTIAFKAGEPTDLSLETGQIIVFASNMLNKGGAYNNKTGIFTVPVSGTYIFMIHLCTRNGINMYYGIMVDDTVYTSGRFYDTNAYSCYTADALVVLSGGEQIYVKCLSGSSSPDVLHEYSSSSYNYWSTFSGLLVHR
ncbi:caprin-2-like [Ruditapes philippinarum]|uniref:caprin-2-like n=1 Tax=Ruditapes philippinarum TaxID=129788 RepID=UPI00295B6250|nr:caprin-2-like [Ruditapes philippinarum]